MELTLKKYFGYSALRPYQKEIIENILEGKDCLVVVATGSGKSLCYQVPPLVVNKTAVVISPLLSLMQDQVMALRQRGIKADHLSSAQTDLSVQHNAEHGQFDILYMTPEKACSISISVSPKGLQFLSSSKPDNQPTLFLMVTSEMSGDEEYRNKLSEFGEFNGLAPLKNEGLSEEEAQLYKMLFEERMKLARAGGTAPYAICGDQTLKKIALTRPSTNARLANIDGVNQAAISKVDKDKLKPIKYELPEECEKPKPLWHLNCTPSGHVLRVVHAEVIPPTHSICRRTDEHSIQRSELPPTSNHPSCMEEGPCDSEKPVGNMVSHYISEISEGEGLIHADNSTSPKQPLVYTNDLLSSSKRQKVDAPEGENSLALELTESSLLNWLKNCNDGVSPSDILEQFNGSTKESLLEMMNCLETLLHESISLVLLLASAMATTHQNYCHLQLTQSITLYHDTSNVMEHFDCAQGSKRIALIPSSFAPAFWIMYNAIY
ncbi:hypothetical protein Acr_15g0003990 [Actinidia rufa]|uniref:RECQ helicase SIM n=1 Tax=Actinidia rufa TaxID=165716 RepID=A0A7J0FUE0_9ERIC|nr:hypothetical protein Acr_15g0003990 [Actinidia rufa]